MRRLLRLLLHTFTLLSFLLFLTCAILWPRSYFVSYGISHGRNGYSSDNSLIRHIRGLYSTRGQINIGSGYAYAILFENMSPRNEGFNWMQNSPPQPDSSNGVVWSHLGFRYRRFVQPAMYDLKFLDVPFWFVTIAFILLPVFWLRIQLRQRRQSPHACPTCGYDLRASPNRCPECGTPSAPTTTVTISP